MPAGAVDAVGDAEAGKMREDLAWPWGRRQRRDGSKAGKDPAQQAFPTGDQSHEPSVSHSAEDMGGRGSALKG